MRYTRHWEMELSRDQGDTPAKNLRVDIDSFELYWNDTLVDSKLVVYTKQAGDESSVREEVLRVYDAETKTKPRCFQFRGVTYDHCRFHSSTVMHGTVYTCARCRNQVSSTGICLCPSKTDRAPSQESGLRDKIVICGGLTARVIGAENIAGRDEIFLVETMDGSAYQWVERDRLQILD